ncbi:MAG: hypothetical protein ACOX6H_04265 [Christensenellales bacterium]|jgi:hypothetical protein
MKKEILNCGCFIVCDCKKTKINKITNPSGGSGGGSVNCVGSTGSAGPTGPTGQNGENAYEIAVLNGFDGTLEQWQETLIGPTGTMPAIGTLVPFSAAVGEASYEYRIDGTQQALNFMGFFTEEIDWLVDDEEYRVFDLTTNDEDLPAFVVQKDSFITGISFEMHAEVETDNTALFDYVVTVLVYHSPKNSHIFTVVDELTFQLQPVLNGNQITSVYGIKESNFFVETGSKIAVAISVFPTSPITGTETSFLSVFGYTSAGLTLNESV